MWNFKIEKLALVALIAILWPVVDATSPLPAQAEDLPAAMQASGTAAPANSTTQPLDSSPCVLLRNDNVLFGVARQLGEFVIVETGHGAEIKLARQEVLCWSNSLRNLYRYRIDHRQQRDLSAMVRDARWCMRYDLYDLAAQEIRKIRSVDPRNVEATQIEDQLRRRVAAESATLLSDNVTNDTPAEAESEAIKIVGYDAPGEEESGTVDLRALRRFASHVQPMLVTRCGRCHDAANHDPEGWTLVLPSGGSRASSRMTRDNLASTLAYVNSEQPDQSQLFTKATSAHGGQEAPLDARSAKAIDSLRVWLWMAAASIIQPLAEDPPRIASIERDPALAREIDALGTPSGVESVNHVTESPGNADDSRSGPSRLPQVANPFDPDLFNRRFHVDSSDDK